MEMDGKMEVTALTGGSREDQPEPLAQSNQM
jgi:hypothetical protein